MFPGIYWGLWKGQREWMSARGEGERKREGGEIMERKRREK